MILLYSFLLISLVLVSAGWHHNWFMLCQTPNGQSQHLVYETETDAFISDLQQPQTAFQPVASILCILETEGT